MDTLSKRFEKLFGLSIKVFIFTSIVVISLGIYIANLIYGDSSLMQLKKLQKEELYLKNETEALKEKNAQLHKKYLELKDASG